MKKTKLQRLTALVLALAFLCGGYTLSASASDSETSVTDKTLAEIREELNAIKYSEYMTKVEFAEAARDVEELVIDATQYYSEGTNADVKVEEYDGVRALYTPGSGTVAWKFNLPKASLYAIRIRYYPVEGKSAAIERVLKINGTIPFSEARYVTMQKNWTCAFVCELEVNASDVDAMISEAKAAGINASSSVKTKTDKKGNQRDVTYFVAELPEVITSAANEFINKYSLRFFTKDMDANEIRSSLTQTPEWRTYECSDIDGFYSSPFDFVFSEGENILSLEAKNEPVAIESITLVPVEDYPTYEEYKAAHNYAGKNQGTSTLKVEGEYFSSASSQTIYPLEDRTDAANSPTSSKFTVLNTVGGEKWEVAGQSLRYTFSVDTDGLYSIAMRFKQNILDGMSVARTLRLYSEGVNEGEDGYYNGVPFEEATRTSFPYDSDWQVKKLGYRFYNTETKKNEDVPFEFYFKAGVKYTMELEVTLGDMGDIIRRVQTILDSINEDYLNIIRLTGANPDQYRDYGFFRVMPDTLQDLYFQSRALRDEANGTGVAYEIERIIGAKSSNVATLDQVQWLCNRMINEDEVAKNLKQLKTYIGTLGTWITDAKTQPLQVDYFCVQGAEEKLPKAKAGFFSSIFHEVQSFFMSFKRNYDRMGAVEETYSEEDAVEVWLASGRDQSQIVRNLVNNDFTPNPDYGHPVSIKLVTAATLLPSVLAGMGPDVYIGLGEDNVINYAIRGALEAIEDQPDFDDAIKDFNDAAMLVLGIDDAQGVHHYYGLPETQNFPMMFIRTDILANLGIEIPKTWDDILTAVSVLGKNNMEVGLLNNYKIFLYQKGGELFADNGMRINLDSNVALDSFEMMCNMFTMYSFPYKYDFENRFRTGEMPIGIASYNATYNKLTVFATEIKGLWTMVPLPGIIDEETGKINNVSVSTVTAIVMLTGCENKEGAWDFMKWHSGTDFQIKYSNEMIATIGPSAKHPTANREALSSLDWTTEEYTNIALQFNNLASIPNYPGSYIIDRYTRFAFLSAYNDYESPVDELQSYIKTINDEITRKREEFGLETLEQGQTLKSKRIDQCRVALTSDIEKMGSAAEQAAEDLIKNKIERALKSGDAVAIRDAAKAAREYDAVAFADTITALERAADAIEQ